MTSRMHYVFQALTIAGQALNTMSGLVPHRYQPFVTFGLAFISSVMGLYNHYYRPDGSKIV